MLPKYIYNKIRFFIPVILALSVFLSQAPPLSAQAEYPSRDIINRMEASVSINEEGHVILEFSEYTTPGGQIVEATSISLESAPLLLDALEKNNPSLLEKIRAANPSVTSASLQRQDFIDSTVNEVLESGGTISDLEAKGIGILDLSPEQRSQILPWTIFLPNMQDVLGMVIREIWTEVINNGSLKFEIQWQFAEGSIPAAMALVAPAQLDPLPIEEIAGIVFLTALGTKVTAFYLVDAEKNISVSRTYSWQTSWESHVEKKVVRDSLRISSTTGEVLPTTDEIIRLNSSNDVQFVSLRGLSAEYFYDFDRVVIVPDTMTAPINVSPKTEILIGSTAFQVYSAKNGIYFPDWYEDAEKVYTDSWIPENPMTVDDLNEALLSLAEVTSIGQALERHDKIKARIDATSQRNWENCKRRIEQGHNVEWRDGRCVKVRRTPTGEPDDLPMPQEEEEHQGEHKVFYNCPRSPRPYTGPDATGTWGHMRFQRPTVANRVDIALSHYRHGELEERPIVKNNTFAYSGWVLYDVGFDERPGDVIEDICIGYKCVLEGCGITNQWYIPTAYPVKNARTDNICPNSGFTRPPIEPTPKACYFWEEDAAVSASGLASIYILVDWENFDSVAQLKLRATGSSTQQ